MSAEDAARWLAEAFESGNPLGALPSGIAPGSIAAGEEAAFATLDALGVVPCGVRLLRRGGVTLAGPMIEGRLLPAGVPVALGALRHPEVTPAVIGVLAAPLDPDGTRPPRFARLHPALDISATRFGEAPEDAALLTADLARLGLVVAGKAVAAKPGEAAIAFGAKGARPRPAPVQLAGAFKDAAAVARRLGGLPKGALLIVAGLMPAREATGTLRARFDTLGAVEAAFG